MHVFRGGSRVAACKGSFRTARLRTVKSKEDWSLWASTAALRLQPTKGALKRALEAVHLTEDGAVPLHITGREALLRDMQRKDFPLGLHRQIARHLLVQVVRRINQRAAAGSVTRPIKVRAHRAEPLNEQADSLAAEAAESDDS